MSHAPPGVRAGTVLIMVSGIVALLASLSFAFLARMRADVEETNGLVAETQARIMLLAACGYVLEGSRLGYDAAPAAPPVAPPGGKHREAFGWLDVRDGGIGPRGDDPGWPEFYSDAPVVDSDGDRSPDRPAWPALRSVARCPMHVPVRPPFAIEARAVYNPIDVTPGGPDEGFPYLRDPDPQPFVTNGWPGAVGDAIAVPTAGGRNNWELYVTGDRRPRVESAGRSWFRVYRDDIATFVVTCGAGSTQGFRDWGEVLGADAAEVFGSRAAFEDARAMEVRTWYRIHWSAAVLAPEYDNICSALRTPNGSDGRWDSLVNPTARDHYMLYPPNASHTWGVPACRTSGWNKNLGGTISWVQRLAAPPTSW